MLALPSLKEGWGLVVGEAAAHRVPTLAYRSAGGTTESVTDGVTGLLADDRDEFELLLRRLIDDADLRTSARRRRLQAGQRATPGSTRRRRSQAVIDAAVRGAGT